ncbi:MAG: hypothetical protein GEV04_21875 [Actinophytocola sp.]|nr:hypothetical protein [Actinophytocola sp.]
MTTTIAPAVRPYQSLYLPPVARVAMAACAVLAPLSVLAGVLVHPADIGTEDRAAVEQFAANLGDYPPVAWLHAAGLILWLPALLALGRVARPQAPRLGLAGLILALALAIPTFDYDGLTYVALDAGLDVDTVTALVTAASSLPAGILDLLFFAGLIGLILLGVAVLRGQSAPSWAGLALIVAPLAIPVSWFSGSLAAFIAAWSVLLIGFAGCGYALITARR